MSGEKYALLIMVVIALTVLTSATYAADEKIPPCAAHDEMADKLLRLAKESPVSVGLMPKENSVMELYASELGTWTIVLTPLPNGEACIKAYGTNFQMITPPWKERGARR